METLVYVESLIGKGFQFYTFKTEERASNFVNAINNSDASLIAKIIKH